MNMLQNKTIVRSGEYKAPECDIIALEAIDSVLQSTSRTGGTIPVTVETPGDWD